MILDKADIVPGNILALVFILASRLLNLKK